MINSIEYLIQDNLSSVDHVLVENHSKNHENHKHYNKNSHFKVTVISDDFVDLIRVRRHQLILKILEKTMNENNIHSISLSLLTNEEHNKIKLTE